jgi:hypothetical protein
MNGLVTESKVSEVCAHDSIAGTTFSPSVLIIGGVKSYLWSMTNGSQRSGDPNECTRAGTRAIARDKGQHTSFAYPLADLHGGTYSAAIAHERDNHEFLGIADPDLIRLLFEGFEIPVIDFADDINKHAALAVRRMNRDARGRAASSGQHY